MTTQEIIEQTETLSINEQKSLISFLVLKYINPDKKQDFMHLFDYKNDFEKKKNTETDDIYNTIVTEQFLNGYSEEDNIYNSL